MEQLVYLSIIFIVMLCLWTIIAYPKNYLFKAIFIPLVLIVSISVGVTYKALLGYPTDSEAGGYQVYHYFIPDQQNKVIYVLLTRVGESKPRLYAYPWNKDLLESLKKAEEKRGQTVKVVGEFRNPKKKDGKLLDTGRMLFYMLPPQVWLPKTKDNSEEDQ